MMDEHVSVDSGKNGDDMMARNTYVDDTEIAAAHITVMI